MNRRGRANLTTSKAGKLFSLAFSLFILWVIYLANTDADNIILTAGKTPYVDKVGHFALYGTLALAVNLAFQLRSLNLWGVHVHVGTVAVFLFALAEECTQGFIPARTLDAVDIVFDVLGLASAHAITRYTEASRIRTINT